MSLWRPYTQEMTAPPALRLESARGAHLLDHRGRRFFDGVSSWWLITHGHCQPEIVEAIRLQVAQLDQVLFANFTHAPAEELAELLIALMPPSLTRVFLSDNGSTAVEVALKMALQFCAQSGSAARTKFIAFEGAYHGDTVGAMSVSGRGVYTKPYRRTLFDVISAQHPRHGDAEEFTRDFERLLGAHHEETAAVIIEPLVQGAGGMIVWPTEAVRKIAHLCRKFGVLLIFDEVMTGFGRTGRTFAMDHLGVAPDLLCLSKGLTGGALPLAATVASDEIFGAFFDGRKDRMLFHGHSFTGNPLSCAAAVASLRLFKNPALELKWRVIEGAHRASLARLQTQLLIQNARVCGTIGAFDLVDRREGYLSEVASELTSYALGHGLFVRSLGSTIYLMPPYCASAQEVEASWEIIGRCPSLTR